MSVLFAHAQGMRAMWLMLPAFAFLSLKSSGFSLCQLIKAREAFLSLSLSPSCYAESQMYRLKTNFGTCGLHQEIFYHRNSVVAPLNRL